MSATVFSNAFAFTELDVPRSSGAVSGRFRTVFAARVLVGSVLVTCPGALPPSFAFSAPLARGLLLGFFGGFRSRKAHPRGRGVLAGGTGGLGRVVETKKAALSGLAIHTHVQKPGVGLVLLFVFIYV